MKCPKCHSNTKVIRVIKLDNPIIAIRNRICENCGYIFSTQEEISNDSKEDNQYQDTGKDS